MKTKLGIVAGSVITLIAIFYWASGSFKNKESVRIGSLADANKELFAPKYSPRLGHDEAPVQLVEFLDPECETCRVFYPYVKQILDRYGDKIQLVVRYAPFHRNSMNAVKILEATREQNKYWMSLEHLFANQPIWADHHNPKPEKIWDLLLQIDVDIEKVKNTMNNQDIAARIQQDINAVDELGVRKTPSFFVNGRPLLEFGLDQLLALIDDELKKSNSGR